MDIMDTYTKPPPTPKTFTNFSLLPAELRIRIWEQALPDARTLVIKPPSDRKQAAPPRSLEEAMMQLQSDESDINADTWYSPSPVPALLHVNAEARHEALKHYQLSLGAGSHAPRIYVDFSRDTLFFGNSALTQECCSKLLPRTSDMDKIQRLAVVPEGAWRILRSKRPEGWEALRKIVFVHGTDGLDLGPLPQLLEDDDPVLHDDRDDQEKELKERLGSGMELDEDAAATSISPLTDSEAEIKERIQAARDELETLMMVLSSDWATKHKISTAVFAR